MDPEAITKCMEYDLPILVFNFRKEGNIEQAVLGERVGTLIQSAMKQQEKHKANALGQARKEREERI